MTNESADDSEPSVCKKKKMSTESIDKKSPPALATMTLPMVDPGTGRCVWLMTGQTEQQQAQVMQSSTPARTGGMFRLADVFAEVLKKAAPSTVALQTSQASTIPSTVTSIPISGLSTQSPSVSTANRTVFITSDGPTKNILSQLFAAANLNSLTDSSQFIGGPSIGNEQALDMSVSSNY